MLASASKTLTRPFMDTVQSLTPSGVIHAKRRTEEVEMAAEAVADAGIEPLMTRATAARLRWKESLGLKDHFKGVVPENYKIAIDAIVEKMQATQEGGRIGPNKPGDRRWTCAARRAGPLEKATMRKVILRLVPFLMICYFFALLDRVNVGFAALQMNKDLGLTPAMFGFAASLFFVSYFLVEVPSNLAAAEVRRPALDRPHHDHLGAGHRRAWRSWSGRTRSMRCGSSSARRRPGSSPARSCILTYWLPSQYRARILATFTVSIPLATFLGSPLSVEPARARRRAWPARLAVAVHAGRAADDPAGLACLFVLTDKPAQATWLAPEQREWLTGRMEAEAAVRKPVGHLSLWQLATNKYFLVMALVCSGASATGSVLSVWQPQLLKSFGLTNLQTGFVNAIPYGIATVLMVLWGRHSDKTGERRWHTAIPLLLAAGGFTALGLTGTAVVPTIIMVTCCLVGAYAFKGPFWALSASWLSAEHARGRPRRDQRDLPT